ncbi:hypothetical protein [Cellulomonas fengjieae]|uniref:Uncharacterized protein n=1 Tax=Cellulomonas fengjieae TaxID=2819978 RepID=A0ABS3SJ49_9CELL|nr:hypothetical protein [Cellulomonas fengjieae]MBO3085779.1 hypothetical protein [Cellulomonas fengjieae]MBO3102889.1 hypothetical protein [Cellulomonas fengjieae]QVI67516.1 hypothetical protein KG102_08145 [Cellulomonas fengjieae]
MTSDEGSTPTNDDASSTEEPDTAYDASADPDADPGMLNPRTGAAAAADGSETDQDPDSDPNQLNPRGD